MANFNTVFTPSTPTQVVAGLAAGTASAELTIAADVFAINADQAITIAFGITGMAAPTATTGYRIPANTEMKFDLGANFDCIRVFNTAGSAANIFILPLQRS